MAEDMTLAEVARMLTRIENGMAELREDMAHRFNRTVSAELYSVQHQSIQTDLAEMRSDIDRHYREARNSTAELRDEIQTESQQRIADRRWWLTAIGIPVCAMVLQYVEPLIKATS